MYYYHKIENCQVRSRLSTDTASVHKQTGFLNEQTFGNCGIFQKVYFVKYLAGIH